MNSGRKRWAGPLVLCAGFFLPALGWSATILVPADYPGIQQALDAATDGDTILVSPGTYLESLNVSKNVTLVSEGGAEVTTIDGSWADQALLLANSPTIDGFTLLNSPGPDADNAMNKRIIYGVGTRAVISNNILAFRSENQLGCYADAIRLEQGEYDEVRLINNSIVGREHPTTDGAKCGLGITILGGNSTISGNRIEQLMNTAITLVLSKPSTSEISGNTLSDNSSGIYIRTHAQANVDVLNNSITGFQKGYSGFFWDDQNNTPDTYGGLRLMNNTIAHNAVPGFMDGEVRIQFRQAPVLIQNNIISSLGTGGVPFSCLEWPTGNTLVLPQFVSNNIYVDSRYTQNFIGCEPSYSRGGSWFSSDYDVRGKNGNISVYSQFSDPAAGDFRPAQSSPVIDAGSLLPVLPPDTDVMGQERIISGIIDMGAYEFDPLNPPPQPSAQTQEFSDFRDANLGFGQGKKGATPLTFSAYLSVYTAEGFNLDRDSFELKIEDATGVLYQLNVPAGGFKFKAKQYVIGWGLKTPKLAIVSDVNDPEAHNAFSGYIQLEDKKFKLPRTPGGQVRLSLKLGSNYGVLEMNCLNAGGTSLACSTP